MILIAYMQSLAAMGEVASDPGAELSDIRNPSPVLHAAAALVLLLLATLLGVFKPQGMTRYGRRKLQEERARLTEV